MDNMLSIINKILISLDDTDKHTKGKKNITEVSFFKYS